MLELQNEIIGFLLISCAVIALALYTHKLQKRDEQ